MSMSKEKGMESECRAGRSLPEELEMKILTKLPAKSLMRFKCVSKTWRSLITTDSHFISSHLRHQHDSNSSQSSILFMSRRNLITMSDMNRFRILLLRDELDVVNLDISYIIRAVHRKSFNIQDMTVCCNGLVCLLIRIPENFPELILWNPATREFRILPKPTPFASHDSKEIIPFCDASINSGFDPWNKDYKLVRIANIMWSENNNYEIKTFVHVFSIKSSSWREVEPHPGLLSCVSSSSVELNGVLYWLFNRRCILSFDLSDQKFREIDTPSTDRDKAVVVELVKWERKSLVAMIRKYACDEVECWLMENNDMSFDSKPTWNRKWTIRIPFLHTWWWVGIWNHRLLVVRRVEIGTCNEQLLSYDLRGEGERLVLSEGDDMVFWKLPKTFGYVESLVSVYPNGNSS